jgi:E3 ubiquitin-protein ligase HUWE1
MKTRKAKKPLTGPPALVALVGQLAAVDEQAELADALGAVRTWDWPRTDLQCWVEVLNRFDAILEKACADYALPAIQMTAFTPRTKRLVLEILRFTQLLLEHATNRKIFNSYDVRRYHFARAAALRDEHR